MAKNTTESLITPAEAGTLSGLFYERVHRTPDALAYRYFDQFSESWKDLSWSKNGTQVYLTEGWPLDKYCS